MLLLSKSVSRDLRRSHSRIAKKNKNKNNNFQDYFCLAYLRIFLFQRKGRQIIPAFLIGVLHSYMSICQPDIISTLPPFSGFSPFPLLYKQCYDDCYKIK